MKCPRDGTLLVAHSIQNVEMHACPECGGVFVGLYQKEVPALSFQALRPGERSRIPVSEDARLVSPATGKRMIVFRFRGVEIDYCPDSNSVWLDRGEWEKITTAVDQKNVGAGNRAISDVKSDIKSAGDSIINGMDAAFSSIDVATFIGDAISSIFDSW